MFLLSDEYYKNNHSCFLLQYHLVLVTKYRHPCLTDGVKDTLLQYTQSYFEQRDCIIQKVNTNKDHIHILFDAPPHIRAIVEKLFTSRGKKMYNESEVKKDVKQ